MSIGAATDREDYRDAFGNICTRLMLPTGMTTLSCDFVIEDSGKPDPKYPADQQPVGELPAEVLTYLLGSLYCDTDRLTTEAWRLFGDTAPGSPRVRAIVDLVHQHITYGYCYARATRTAYEAYEERVGVCRDFAHLAVALCRCMNFRHAIAAATWATSAYRPSTSRWIFMPGSKCISVIHGTHTMPGIASRVPDAS